MAVLHPRTRLDSFVEGALSPSSRARVAAHLADCTECQREVEQRERILRAATSLGPVPGQSGHRTVPVLERRDGVAGWKVVIGFGAVGLLTSGVLMTAWIAGEPETGAQESAQSQLLSFSGGSSPVSRTDGARSSGASTTGAAPEAVPLTPQPAEVPDRESPSPQAVLAPAGSLLSAVAGNGPEARVQLTLPQMTDLRQAGWNLPPFHGLGMTRTSADWQRGDGVAEVVVALTDDGSTLEFHECRTLQGTGPAPRCPVDGPGGTADLAWGIGAAGGAGAAEAGVEPGVKPVAGPLSRADAAVVQLPVGVDMHLRKRADGSWTAALSTAQAGYVVDSDLPVEAAPRVMSMVVISERARVQGGAAPDSAGERLARGFERLLPWTGVTEPQRR